MDPSVPDPSHGNENTEHAMDEADEVRSGVHDIYHIAFLLRQKLASDIVPLILRHAELFESFRYTRNHATVIREAQSPFQYLTTRCIRSSARVQYPVQKVIFTICSHDQGWVSDRNGGNWTWFTAVATAGDEGLERESIKDATDASTSSIREVEVARNKLACPAAETKVVELRRDSSNAQERQWVSSLRNGDRIALHSWALFGGWCNHVKAAHIDIYMTAIVA